MSDKKFDLEDRCVELAANIALFYKDFPSDFTGQYYGNPLLRSGGSAALNFGQVQGVLKELKESRVNLRILSRVNYGSEKIKKKLLNGIEQWVKMISTIIKSKTP